MGARRAPAPKSLSDGADFSRLVAEIREFWLAKGACARCGAPVARRVEGPGVVEVVCNRCRSSTPVSGVRMLQEEGRPPVPAPMEAPAAPEAAPPRRRSAWIAAAAFAGGVLLVAALAWILLAPSAPPSWTSLNETLVPEFGQDEVRFRVELTARDAEGNVLPRDQVTGVPDWYFAHGATLAPTPEGLDWKACNPTNCTYVAPAGSVVYYNSFFPSDHGADAFDTANRTLFSYGFGEWRPVPDWEARFRSHLIVRAVPIVPGENGGWHLMVFSNASNAEERILNVTLVQGGKVVESGIVHASSPFGSAWKMPEFSATVGKGPVEVRVLDEAGALLASRTVTPSSCDKVSTQVYVAVSEEGRVTMDEVLCI